MDSHLLSILLSIPGKQSSEGDDDKLLKDDDTNEQTQDGRHRKLKKSVPAFQELSPLKLNPTGPKDFRLRRCQSSAAD